MKRQIVNVDSYIVDPDFVPTEVEAKYGWTKGTVEVTLGGQTRRCRASDHGDEITAFDLGGRYQTGTKVWPACVTSYKPDTGHRLAGCEYPVFGRDDRDPKFKLSCIFFVD